MTRWNLFGLLTLIVALFALTASAIAPNGALHRIVVRRFANFARDSAHYLHQDSARRILDGAYACDKHTGFHRLFNDSAAYGHIVRHAGASHRSGQLEKAASRGRMDTRRNFRGFLPHPRPSTCRLSRSWNGCTAATPGSARGLYLIVSDVEAARKELLGRGVEMSEVFHDAGGAYAGPDDPYLFGRIRISGRDPEQRSYRSFASFSDPDGNGWLFQELTHRAPGRLDADVTTFTSTADLAAALRRAEAAHGEHEKRTGGQRDENWPDWYAEYMASEQAGKDLPL
ncbi:hypothetical protein M3I54_08710 [Paraburkholderia sp. CNPSo 3274]|uniref:VOC family protein n=1 Tax=Paraburkholderia sp. CNPSo 3274 TaxID=2940932 RepID=UPI0020B8B4D4|nr:hypothetical protein [Paraburkholderia sp. CNPSo 3274]MCP3707064.1 hypothetical protein [Paraburkholderia sp. CNPSo 3274]